MNKIVSIIIPSRNEKFLQPTIKDLIEKAEEEIEIIVILDGYYPDPPLENHPCLKLIHRGTSRGMRDGINSAVAIAKGEYIMKIDAHCMVDQGYDVKLKADCEDNWVCIPTRKRLDVDNWCPSSEMGDSRPDINYLYIVCPDVDMVKLNQDINNHPVNGDLGGEEWRQKNSDKELSKIKIDDCMAFQGSCWFMKKAYFYELELMDEKNYGTFRKEPQEIAFKCWLSGGRVIRNKNTWYAHLHKGKVHGRGYTTSRPDWAKGDEYNKKWLTNTAWDKQTKKFKWFIEKFNPPGWENFKWE